MNFWERKENDVDRQKEIYIVKITVSTGDLSRNKKKE